MTRKPVSVVIPCRSAAAAIADQLAAVVAELSLADDELILSDNDGRDGLETYVRNNYRESNIRTVDATAKVGRTFAVNIGVRAARNEFIVILDADDLIERGYIAAMSLALELHDLVGARVADRELNHGWVRESRDASHQGLADGYGFLPHVSGCAMAVRRSAFDAVGGFDEVPFGEDVDFSWRVQLGGFTAGEAQGAVLQYRYRESFGGVLRQAIAYGKAQPLLFRLYRDRGMPRRSVGRTFHDWRAVLRRLVRARRKSDIGWVCYAAGLVAGRLLGSVANSVVYL